MAPTSSPDETALQRCGDRVDGGGRAPGRSGAASRLDASPLLSLRGVTKSFGAVQALRDVDLDILPGKVTALVGDNGAGKSTMIKTISGIWHPSAGQILWDGAPVTIRTPRDADALGIATVYQDLALCDNLDIVQNMFLGHETAPPPPARRGDHGDDGQADPGTCRSPPSARSASPWRRCRAASASRWPWPRP